MLTLKKHYPNAQIYTAKDGIEALEKIKEYKNIKLILTDYEMPNMDGLELIKKIREKYTLNDKIIIAISSATNKAISATLLKVGANDFLTKPFIDEELTCRCDNNFKICMLMDEVRELAFKDSLTGLYNRRYFFDIANKIYLTSLRNEKPISVLMCDIDHFKNINDTYGHQVGDIVIKNTATILKAKVRKNDLVARYGGEEFVLLLYNCDIKNAYKVGEKIRSCIEKIVINQDIKYTISIGVSNKGLTLEEMIKNSDDMLYKAKKTRNSVVVDI
jgi:diguanylate cyclase (GGDEF)-like protein